MIYLSLLLKSFKLETKFIKIIQQDTLTITDLTPVQQILKKKFRPRLSIFKRVIKPFFRVRQNAT